MAKAGPRSQDEPSQDEPMSADDEALIACGLRTLEAEAGGLTALGAAMRDGLGAAFVAAAALIKAAARPGHRHRHGQVRPYRQQDRGDAVLDGNAGLLRAPRRGEPRRPRHDHARRRDHRALMVGRDRRAQEPDRLFPPLPHRPHRRHRGRPRARSARRPTSRWCCRRRARPARTTSRPPPPR